MRPETQSSPTNKFDWSTRVMKTAPRGKIEKKLYFRQKTQIYNINPIYSKLVVFGEFQIDVSVWKFSRPMYRSGIPLVLNGVLTSSAQPGDFGATSPMDL